MTDNNRRKNEYNSDDKHLRGQQIKVEAQFPTQHHRKLYNQNPTNAFKDEKVDAMLLLYYRIIEDPGSKQKYS